MASVARPLTLADLAVPRSNALTDALLVIAASLVTAAAGMAEAFLRHDQARRDEALREAYLERIAGTPQPTALVRSSGHVLMAVPHGWLPARVDPPHPGRELVLPNGGSAEVEPLPGLDGHVLWACRAGARTPRQTAPVHVELLGREPRVMLPGGPVHLSGRHAEIVAVLLLAERGLTAEQLALEVYGETGKPVTLRAEMSRLRRLLGDVLQTRPYRFAVPVTSDLAQAEQLLAEGRVAEALKRAAQRLLPRSEAPRVIEARDRLEEGLRTTVLAAGDAELLAAWCRSAPGQDDQPAARALLGLLAAGDPRRPAARALVARLDRVFGR